MPRKSKEKSSSALSRSAQKPLKDKLQKRSVTLDRKNGYGSSVSAKLNGNPQYLNDEYKITGVHITKQNKVQYVGEISKTGQVKHLNRKAIIESDEIFSKVMNFYASKLKELFSDKGNELKQELNSKKQS